MHTLLKNNVINRVGGRILYLVKGPFTLEPGEVVIAQPIAGTGNEPGTGEAELGYSLGNNTGVAMTNLKSGEIRLPLSTSVGWAFKASDYLQGSTSDEVRHEMCTSLPGNSSLSLAQIVADLRNKIGEQTQFNLQVLWSSMRGPATFISPFAVSNTTSIVRSEPVSNLVNTKEIFGANALLVRPASDGTSNANPVEMFARFNPATMLMNRDWYAHHFPSQQERVVSANSEFEVRNLLGIDFSGSARQTFYGLSYQNTGSTTFPLLNIPTAPIYSLASFADANLSVNGTDPLRAVGNSWSNPNINPIKPYMEKRPSANGSHAGPRLQDFSWLINDALFDRYYLSGIAPEFAIDADGYSLAPLRNKDGDVINNAPTTGESIKHTLDFFYNTDPVVFGSDYSKANANPALVPYLPQDKTSEEVVDELMDLDINGDIVVDDGYKKIGAYSLIKGAFNVNSTSVQAWRAFLQGNKDLALESVQGTTDAGTGSPFPLGSTTSNTSSNNGWEKFSRLTDDQIWDDNDTPNDLTDDTGLAVEIVNQVKARGPFMSISDFVNRRIGAETDPRSYHGAIQEAIEQAEINDLVDPITNLSIRDRTSDVIPNYSNYGLFPYADGTYLGDRNNATGVPLEVNQANILLPLAPRLSARSDTFRIRAYGEVRDADDIIIASAICEAVVQRLPEYVDPKTIPNDNEPWDESNLNTLNQIYGRRFEIRSFRWLDAEEV